MKKILIPLLLLLIILYISVFLLKGIQNKNKDIPEESNIVIKYEEEYQTFWGKVSKNSPSGDFRFIFTDRYGNLTEDSKTNSSWFFAVYKGDGDIDNTFNYINNSENKFYKIKGVRLEDDCSYSDKCIPNILIKEISENDTLYLINEDAVDIYEKEIEGTIIEKVLNAKVPSYYEDDELYQLENGVVEIRTEPSLEFSNGYIDWVANLSKSTNSFVIDDFNNDGLDDVAHIIGYTGGGTGYFIYLYIFINDGEELKYSTNISLGDRVKIRSIEYESGIFSIDMITHGEGDEFMGYCCASVPVIYKIKFEDNKLFEV